MMFGRKYNLVIGLTTFNVDLLRISVPPLARLKSKFLLVVYNDNPACTISRRQIRRLGYRGAIKIVNGTENLGTLRARMAIVDAVNTLRHQPDWIIFINDNDILINADIPAVSDNVFAVMHNALSVRRCVCDLFVAMAHPQTCGADGVNTVLVRPNHGICGTPIRFNVMNDFCVRLMSVMSDLDKIDAKLAFRPPYDEIMWACLNTYARTNNMNVLPIYMDDTNYVMCDLDTVATKYGRAVLSGRDVQKKISDTIAKYDAVLAAALVDDAAAPRGNE